MTPNLPASVRQRLLNLARARGDNFDAVLGRFAIERLLYRLAESAHHDRFILKGATLFALWTHEPHRATRDLDLLGSGEPDVAALEEVFQQLCTHSVLDDGLTFDPASVAGARIRDDQPYQGVRIRLRARLGQARIPLQVDIGFGDAVVPAPAIVDYPVLLGHPAPRIKAYPREAVVAEKYHAIVHLGVANSRMKDFYDLVALATLFDFASNTLADALSATFARRKTPLPMDTPIALTGQFSRDPQKQTAWTAFLRRSAITAAASLPDTISLIKNFLSRPLHSAIINMPLHQHWPPKGPWTSKKST